MPTATTVIAPRKIVNLRPEFIARLLVVEPISQLHVDFPWIVPVETAESLAVVEIHAPVGHVQRIYRYGEMLAKVFAEREIERGVSRQVISWIRLIREGVTEAGAVVHVRGCPRAPRQGHVPAKVERVRADRNQD